MIFEDMKLRNKKVLITILLSKTEIDKPVTEREKETSCGLPVKGLLRTQKTLTFRHVMHSDIDIPAYPVPIYYKPCVLGDSVGDCPRPSHQPSRRRCIYCADTAH